MDEFLEEADVLDVIIDDEDPKPIYQGDYGVYNTISQRVRALSFARHNYSMNDAEPVTVNSHEESDEEWEEEEEVSSSEETPRETKMSDNIEDESD